MVPQLDRSPSPTCPVPVGPRSPRSAPRASAFVPPAHRGPPRGAPPSARRPCGSRRPRPASATAWLSATSDSRAAPSSGSSRWSEPRIAQVLISRPSARRPVDLPGRATHRRRTRMASSADDATWAWTPPRRRTTSTAELPPDRFEQLPLHPPAERLRPTDTNGHERRRIVAGADGRPTTKGVHDEQDRRLRERDARRRHAGARPTPTRIAAAASSTVAGPSPTRTKPPVVPPRPAWPRPGRPARAASRTRTSPPSGRTSRTTHSAHSSTQPGSTSPRRR